MAELETNCVNTQCLMMNESNRCGSATLVNGVASVSCDSVLSSDIIIVSHYDSVGTLGELYCANIVENVSFEVHSSSLLDQSTIHYLLVKK